MKKTNIAKLKWEHWKSPKGKFAQSYKDISGAVGDVRGGWPRKGHPFNLEIEKVPPGKASCPFHRHSAQWELFVIISGTGTVRANQSRFRVKAGDVIMHPPGEAHQIINTGKRDLVFYLIADNPPVDGCHYPDSKKWSSIRPHRRIFRISEVDYYDGEE
ncbi:MAG: cupin domain-containing protein [Opitutaceae bacterium]|nr:cupin domain-containing protein [Opitutaceae bacterium]